MQIKQYGVVIVYSAQLVPSLLTSILFTGATWSHYLKAQPWPVCQDQIWSLERRMKKFYFTIRGFSIDIWLHICLSSFLSSLKTRLPLCVLELTCTGSWEPLVHFLGILQASGCHIGSLKSSSWEYLHSGNWQTVNLRSFRWRAS